MDVRNWEFLSDQLSQFDAISKELSGSGVADKIAYTAFFWTLIQYHESDGEIDYSRGAMSLPDHLTPGQRATIEHISALLDAWLKSQAADSHPQYASLRRIVDIGLQATTAPIFDPRSFS